MLCLMLSFFFFCTLLFFIGRGFFFFFFFFFFFALYANQPVVTPVCKWEDAPPSSPRPPPPQLPTAGCKASRLRKSKTSSHDATLASSRAGSSAGAGTGTGTLVHGAGAGTGPGPGPGPGPGRPNHCAPEPAGGHAAVVCKLAGSPSSGSSPFGHGGSPRHRSNSDSTPPQLGSGKLCWKLQKELFEVDIGAL
eukprot:NODE_5637_length_1749_cov_3.337855.p4 GENE.NODE_5637_length_1749_cov_3.337855~~NODE_5637_length_1749_cov_3.337855.p4  ORF type:complete len:193 (+),score=14.32 NODE_5637_length_1749_cov_3.337855:33-611(+)